MIEELDQSWERVELRHLRALDAVARTGSFRGAAVRLGYSLSTVSEQVAGLERLVGVDLVERPGGRRAVSITAAGRRLLDHAPEIVTRYAAARADLEALRLARPSLRLGVFQSVAVRLLPTIVRELRSTRPDLMIDFVERAQDEALLDLTARGDIDVSFAALPVGAHPLAVERLGDDPYVVLVAADGPLARRGSLAAAEVAREPLVDYRDVRPIHHGAQRLPHPSRANVVARTDDNATMHAFVAAGLGVAVIPSLCVDLHNPAVRAIPLEPAVEPRRLALVWHRDRRLEGLGELIEAARGAADHVPDLRRQS
jgi:DNA-binding transcriptional LysR family regulator